MWWGEWQRLECVSGEASGHSHSVHVKCLHGCQENCREVQIITS